MLKYIILLITAVLVFPILIFIIRRYSIGNWIILGTFAGLVISMIGLVMQESFNPLYVLLVMFGLVFAISVLLDKRPKKNGAFNTKTRPKKVELTTIADSNFDAGIQETAASRVEEDDYVIQPIDKDLNNWMSMDGEKFELDESHDRKERPNGE